MSGFLWTTYSALDEMGIFNDIDTVPWDSGGSFDSIDVALYCAEFFFF